MRAELGTGSCAGDFGGPLMGYSSGVYYDLVGISSISPDCYDPSYPSKLEDFSSINLYNACFEILDPPN
jgi:hypothetical protein